MSGPTDPAIRLVATDLDGTLLDSAGAVSPRTREVLRTLEARGVPVVFVTGRPLRWMTDLWPEVGSLGLAIVSNGAVTYDVAAREVIGVHGIEADLGLRLVEAITGELPAARFAIECLDGIRLGPDFAPGDERLASAPTGQLAEIWDEPALKLLVRAPDTVDEVLRASVVAAVGEAAIPTWSMPGLVEVSGPGVTKAAALAGLCEPRGITPPEVVAFGDMPNDVAMLQWAGVAVAMPHAAPEVVEIADRVAPGNDADGVAHVLAEMFGLAR